jgi:hypothetical protein
MQANQRKSSWGIRKRHVLKVCQSEHTVARYVDSWSSTLTLSSQRNDVAEPAAGKAGSAFQLAINDYWPGLPEPERWATPPS